MNKEILETHLSTHRDIVEWVKQKVPQTYKWFHGSELALADVSINGDGCIIAYYCRYIGGGEYHEHNEIISIDSLF